MAPAGTIHALPDQVLGYCFGLAGRGNAHNLALVSQRWRRVVFSEPSLWGSMVIGLKSNGWAVEEHSTWMQHKRALLKLVGKLLTTVTVAASANGAVPASSATLGSQQVASLLRLLSAGRLQSLGLHGSPLPYQGAPWALHRYRPLPAAAIAVLPRFKQLQELVLESWQLPHCTSAVLASLPQLRRLQCATRQLADPLMDCILQLSQLHYLALKTSKPLPAAIQQLTRLQQLEGLVLRQHNASGSQQLRLPCPPAFCSCLKFFDAYTERDYFIVGDLELQFCHYDQNVRGSGRAGLVLQDVLGLSSITWLLERLLPAGALLDSLHLWHSSLNVAAMDAGGVGGLLSALTDLQLHYCYSQPEVGGVPGTMAGLLDAMLAQSPGLRELVVVGCNLGQLPERLVNSQTLRKLVLTDTVLENLELPGGPYLQGLEELGLHKILPRWCLPHEEDSAERGLDELPPALAQATSLRQLDLHGNPNLQLTEHDVPDFLRMPHLSRLDLGVTRTSAGVIWQLFRQAPHLTVT